MPELPEVETIRLGFQRQLRGGRIEQALTLRPDLRFPFPLNFANNVVSTHIIDVRRRAKYLLIGLNNGYTIISHLGMSGSWSVNPIDLNHGLTKAGLKAKANKKHDHFIMLVRQDYLTKADSLDPHIFLASDVRDKAKISSNYFLVTYNDPRRFGFMLYCPTNRLMQEKCVSKLGLEPLSAEFNGLALFNKIKNSQQSFKACLLNQTIVAGLGNIYVCEALWRSGISPLTKVGYFCQTEQNAVLKLTVLCNNIKEILIESLQNGGSSLRDYKDVSGKKGQFQQRFAVYARAGQNCKKCQTIIIKQQQNGRSSFFCPTCQHVLEKQVN